MLSSAGNPARFADAPMFPPELLRELYAHMEWADAIVWSQILNTESAYDDRQRREKLFHIHDTQQAFDMDVEAVHTTQGQRDDVLRIGLALR